MNRLSNAGSAWNDAGMMAKEPTNQLPPLPDKPVNNAVFGIEQRICDLAASVDAIADVLRPILRPEPVQMAAGASGKPGTEPCAPESDLTLKLRQFSSGIEQLVCRLNALRERVEV